MSERDAFWREGTNAGWRLARGTPPFSITPSSTAPVYLVRDGTGTEFVLENDSFVTRNIVTDFGAVGDGVTNNAAAFSAFRGWAQQQTQPVKLVVPAGAYVQGTTQWMNGIDHLHVEAAGPVTWVDTARVGASNGQRQSSLYSVRLEAVSKGSTVLTVKDVDPAKLHGVALSPDRTLHDAGPAFNWGAHAPTHAPLMRLFSVGQWVLLTACDMQGYGFPSNPCMFEYNRIAEIGVNTITLRWPTRYAYPATLPHFSNGGSVSAGGNWQSFEVDQGGPATLYALEPDWDCEVYMKGPFIWPSGDFSVSMSARKITFENCDFSRLIGQSRNLWPSQAKELTFINCGVSNPEIDKLVERLEFRGNSSQTLWFQSADPDMLVIDRHTVTNLSGTAKNAAIRDSVIDDLRVGVFAYGSTESLLIENSRIPSTIKTYFKTYGLGRNPIFEGGNILLHSSTPNITQWAIPGTLIYFTGAGGQTSGARITDVRRRDEQIIVQTDRPSIPLFTDADISGITLDPCPHFTLKNCSGGDFAQAWNAAPDNIPILSFMQAWLGQNGEVTAGGLGLRGHLIHYKVNVTKPYTGTATHLRLTVGQFGAMGIRSQDRYSTKNSDRFLAGVNLKNPGERIYTPNGRTGVQPGDNDAELGDFWFSNFTQVPRLSGILDGSLVDISREDPSVWPEFIAELRTDPLWHP